MSNLTRILDPNNPAQRVFNAAEVQRALGYSKRGFYLLRRSPADAFPKPFVMGGRDAWLDSDIFDWIDSRRRVTATPGERRMAVEMAA